MGKRNRKMVRETKTIIITTKNRISFVKSRELLSMRDNLQDDIEVVNT